MLNEPSPTEVGTRSAEAAEPDHGALYAMAEGQAGYFTARQALQAGIGTDLLSYHARCGRYLRVARGVYRFSQFPASLHEQLVAVSLAAGPRAVVSGETALAVYDLSDVLPDVIHLTVPRTASRRKSGVRLHTNRLGPDEITRREGLRITTVTRTIIDAIAGGLPDEMVQQAVVEAVRRGMATREELLAAAARHGGRAARLNSRGDGSEGTP